MSKKLQRDGAKIASGINRWWAEPSLLSPVGTTQGTIPGILESEPEIFGAPLYDIPTELNNYESAKNSSHFQAWQVKNSGGVALSGMVSKKPRRDGAKIASGINRW